MRRRASIVTNLPLLELLVSLLIVATIYSMAMTIYRDPTNAFVALQTRAFQHNLINTSLVSLVTGVLVAALGYAVAFFIYVYESRIARGLIFILLLPYVSSYYVLLLGWRALWGNGGLIQQMGISASLSGGLEYGGFALVIVMLFRYVPISILLIYLRMRELPLSQIQAALNLGLSSLSIHRRLYFPWVLPIFILLVLFSAILSSLDFLASSLAGGGKVQILANVIDDWHRTHAFQGSAMAIGLLYTVTILVLLSVYSYFSRALVGQKATYGYSEVLLAPRKHGYSEKWVLGILTGMLLLGQIMLNLSILWSAISLSNTGTSSFTNPDLWSSIKISMQVALASSTAGILLATISAVSKYIRTASNVTAKKRLLGLGEMILLLPLVTPPLLLGVSAGAFQGNVLGTYGSLFSTIAVHTISYAPIAYFVVLASLGVLSEQSYAVASNLNVKPLVYVGRILLPTAWPAMYSGWLLIFAFSINDPILARYD